MAEANPIVTLLTETILKGGSVYAECQFSFSEGSQRRLSAKDKMSLKVQALVKHYEQCHLSKVGAYSSKWIAAQEENERSHERADWMTVTMRRSCLNLRLRSQTRSRMRNASTA